MGKMRKSIDCESINENELRRKHNAAKVRKWRASIRKDVIKHTEMKSRERERKKVERTIKRNAAKSDEEKMEELRKRKREEVRRYRLKKKLAVGSKKVKGKNNNGKSKYELDRDNKKLKKAKEVQRVKAWRLKVKLAKAQKEIIESKCEETFESSFSNRWAKYRAIKKVHNMLPKSPRKEMEVIKNLCKDFVIGSNVDNVIIKSVRESLLQTKKQGAGKDNIRLGHRLLKRAILQNVPRGLNLKIRNKLGLTSTNKVNESAN